jgi:hypothetical protein
MMKDQGVFPRFFIRELYVCVCVCVRERERERERELLSMIIDTHKDFEPKYITLIVHVTTTC